MDDRTSTIVVAGGGVTSLSVVGGILRARGPLSPTLKLLWVTGGGKPGRGDEYRNDHAHLAGKPLLNQPTAWMSPDADRPEHCAEWTAKNTQTADHRYAFIPRGTYGDYCEALGRELVEDARRQPGLQLDVRRERAQAITPQHDGTHAVRLTDGSVTEAEGVVLATGHTRSTRLDHLIGVAGYVPKPTDAEKLQAIAATATPSTVVTFFGGGPSMVDGVQLLEGLAYPGRYRVVTRNGWGLWEMEPAKYDVRNSQRVTDYKLSNTQIDAAVGRLAARDDAEVVLTDLYRGEHARNPRLGYYHVLSAFPFAQADHQLREGGHATEASKLAVYKAHAFASPCSPRATQLLRGLEAAGRLEYRKARIEDVKPVRDGFALVLGDNTTLHAEILINAAPFVKGIGLARDARNPLFRQLVEGKVISVDGDGLVETHGPLLARPGLAVVGPASHRATPNWGVESFRKSAADAGAAIVEHVEARSLRAVLSPSTPFHPRQPGEFHGIH